MHLEGVPVRCASATSARRPTAALRPELRLSDSAMEWAPGSLGLGHFERSLESSALHAWECLTALEGESKIPQFTAGLAQLRLWRGWFVCSSRCSKIV